MVDLNKYDKTALAAIALVIVFSIFVVGYAFLARVGTPDQVSNAQGQQPAAVNGIPLQDITNGIYYNVSQSSEFNVSYSGMVTPLLAGNGSLSLPINISYLRYQGNSRTSVSFVNSPIFGNLSTVEIKLANGITYSCSNLQTLAPSQSANEYSCSLGAGNADTLTGLQSSVPSGGIFVNTGGATSYNGMPCTLVYGSGLVEQASTYKVSMCLSARYFVPLNISLALNQSTAGGNPLLGGFSMVANVISIGAPTSYYEVTALPGPLGNSSFFNTTTGYNSSAYCTPAGNYTCQDISISQQGQASFLLGHGGDAVIYNISLSCITAGSMPPITYEGISRLGVAERNTSGTVGLEPGGLLSISGLGCSGLGSALQNGSVVKGTILINYAQSAGAAAGRYINATVAVFSAVVR